MNTVHIPATVEEAMSELNGIEVLLTAKGWQRAAIVAAFVRLPGRGTRRDEERTSTFFTCAQFAERGIAGLKSDRTVLTYVQRWLDANDGIYPEPGSKVELPDAEWEKTRTGTNGHDTPEGASKTIAAIRDKHGDDGLADIITTTAPAAAAAVHERETERRHQEASTEMPPKPGPHPLDADMELHQAYQRFLSDGRRLASVIEQGSVPQFLLDSMANVDGEPGSMSELIDRLVLARMALMTKQEA